MTTIDRRLAALEQTQPDKLVMIFVDNPPTLEQLRAIEDAERAGRTVLRVSWLDERL